MSTISIISRGAHSDLKKVDFQQSIRAVAHCPTCTLPVNECKLCLSKKAVWNHMKNCISDECEFRGCVTMSSAIEHYSVCKGCEFCSVLRKEGIKI